MINHFDGEYGWLSNFYPHPVRYEGMQYPTVENAFQAAKTAKRDFFKTCTPGQAKRRGRTVPLRADWEDIKLEVMHGLLVQKFWVKTPLAKKLLETGTQELVEGNTWGDTFWGICEGKGKNNLGKLLMKVRSSLND